MSSETQAFSTIHTSWLSSLLLRVSQTQDGSCGSRHDSLIQGRKKGGQERVESSGGREAAVGTRRTRKVGPVYPGGAGRPAEVHSAFWTGGLTLFQPAAHLAQVSRGSPVQVCAHPRCGIVVPHQMKTLAGGWEDSIPEVSSPSWWHSGFPQALEMESLGTELCPWEAASLVPLLLFLPHLPLTAPLCSKPTRGTQRARQSN